MVRIVDWEQDLEGIKEVFQGKEKREKKAEIREVQVA